CGDRHKQPFRHELVSDIFSLGSKSTSKADFYFFRSAIEEYVEPMMPKPRND
ncbi:hypothetical protein HMPREF0175_1525, partial [Bifidobacterium longum subsp. longum ATCC 55813]